MNRIGTVTLFYVRNLFRSPAGIVPLAAALAFGLIAFEYGMDQAQFITVAGVGTGALCLLTTLLLASRANRAWSYLLVARLRQRSELLAALVLGSLGITAVLAFLIMAGNLLSGRLSLDFPSALWTAPTWLALWLLAAALALPLSALVGRGGSHLVGWFLLAMLLVVYDQQIRLAALRLERVADAAAVVIWPVSTLLGQASAGHHGRSYFLALGLTLAYAAVLFVLAVEFFADKDLLWPE
ncbi:MAG: hypothetical protein PVF47_01225 [Anaerolineae bacterium]|jgi:hypothetical protein